MPPDDAYVEKTDFSERTPLLPTPADPVKGSKWTQVAQLLILSVVHMLGVSPLAALLSLDGILNPEIGMYALTAHYSGTLISFVTAPVITRKFGAKGTILFGWGGQFLFVAAHFYPQAYLLVPVAFFVGIGHAQTMITNAVYVTTLALRYSDLTKQPQESVMGLFNGIFYSIFMFDGVISNTLSSLVLIKPIEYNVSVLANLSELCGPSFCPWEDTSGTYLRQPEQYIVYILLGVFLGMVAVAFLTTLFFLKNIPATTGDSLHGARAFCGKVGHLMFKRKLVLLIPIFMMIGLEQQFMMTEFTKGFVSCEIGIQYNGWSMVCFGSGQIVGSLVTGRLVKFVNWTVMYVVAACCNIGCLTTMLYFEANFTTMEYYFLVPFAWGLADSVWMTQSLAFTGHMFPEEKWPVFVVCRNSLYATYAALFAYSNFVCMDVKIYIAYGMVTLSFMSFILFSIFRRFEKTG
ncbi:protein unc-93 homolog A-like [Lingula anatina]|uniref:Protein unc-93 homolog A-like n=1 Tax=Lingula anatina TaxID=7574 RepID=A0A1S3IXX1_LINAN|nr:protein unc-93 homolog A-like [Lingula anatina]|eukprot:XP_013402878.1 protein unc-93 homolog A-like [Lingula anatina]